jgi:hypothetical protein
MPGTRWIARKLTCREASRLISQQQDRSIPWQHRLLLRFHLMWCEACRRYVRQTRFLREAMRRFRA